MHFYNYCVFIVICDSFTAKMSELRDVCSKLWPASASLMLYFGVSYSMFAVIA